MQQLTGVDASFLYLESPTTFGHISSLIVFDPGDGDGAGFEATKAALRERMHLLPPFRRRLVEVPFHLDHPYWVDDGEPDLDFHVRETAVAAPGTDEQLGELVARLVARPLDKSRPLWELYVISGLPDGRVAQLTKVHHSAIDGIGGAELLAALLDLEPDPPPMEPHAIPDPEPTPSQAELLRRGLRSMAVRPYRQVRFVTRTVRALQKPGDGAAIDVSGTIERVAGRLPGPVQDFFGRGPRRSEDEPFTAARSDGLLAPHTVFNTKVGPHRRFAFLSLPLERVKTVKQEAGVTVNDVVLAVCAGALRSHLVAMGQLPDASLRAMVPVSVRAGDADATDGNQISSMVASLHTDVDDPAERLGLINQATIRAKESLNALPANLMTEIADFIPPVITARVSRLIARTDVSNIPLPFNLTISNVPGPQFPLYAQGARMLHYFPVSTIGDSQAMNITVQSYDGSLDFGIIADRDAVPDLWELMHRFPDALEALEASVGIVST